MFKIYFLFVLSVVQCNNFYFQKGNLEEAAKLFTEAILKHPTSASMYAKRARYILDIQFFHLSSFYNLTNNKNYYYYYSFTRNLFQLFYSDAEAKCSNQRL